MTTSSMERPKPPNNHLIEVSVTLRTGRTILSKAMDLILTMLGCIILKVDHRARLREFTDMLTEKTLKSLRSDLENLLCFDTKNVDRLILQLVVEAIRLERSWKTRSVRRNIPVVARMYRWNVVALKQKLICILKFLIFRKTRSPLHFSTCDRNNRGSGGYPVILLPGSFDRPNFLQTKDLPLCEDKSTRGRAYLETRDGMVYENNLFSSTRQADFSVDTGTTSDVSYSENIDHSSGLRGEGIGFEVGIFIGARQPHLAALYAQR
ncbi:hypothetical protein KM043_006471 [Ampulex compressa]|nr:hypothetical protein KM043_006471 [Ampulex compressa]